MLNLPLKALRGCFKICTRCYHRLRGGVAIPFIYCLFVAQGCRPSKEIAYYKDLPKDTTFVTQLNHLARQLVVPGDILSINVNSLSPDNNMYNAAPVTTTEVTGYPVDEAGNINFYKIGMIHVAGMTTEALQQKLQEDLTPYLREVLVGVGFVNRHVTLFGGLGPQVLPFTGSSMTIIDAVASGGGIGEKGKAEEILLVRKTGDSTLFKRLDLTKKQIFQSPYFYLQPNDIVYVEPEKVKTTTPQVLAYISAGVSFFLLIINNIIKL